MIVDNELPRNYLRSYVKLGPTGLRALRAYSRHRDKSSVMYKIIQFSGQWDEISLSNQALSVWCPTRFYFNTHSFFYFLLLAIFNILVYFVAYCHGLSACYWNKVKWSEYKTSGGTGDWSRNPDLRHLWDLCKFGWVLWGRVTVQGEPTYNAFSNAVGLWRSQSQRGILASLLGRIISTFYVRHSYAEARLSYRLDVCLCVCLSVCLSVTHWYCIKTAEHIVMLSSPHDSPFILVLCIGLSRSSRNSNGVTPCGPLNRAGVRKYRNFRPINCYISETVEDRWVYTARRFTSIESSFQPCEIYRNCPRYVHRGGKNVQKMC